MQQVHTLTDAIYFGAVDAPAAAAETSALREQTAKIQARGQAAAALNATDAVTARSASLKSVDLPALNATLKAAGLPPTGGGSVRQAIGRKTRTTHPAL